MSSYNGDKFIKKQINSILNQEGVKSFLLIRDDGSSDNTCSIIKSIEKNNKGRVRLIEGKNEGYKRSFMDLVYACPQSYDYYAFADQDDVWLSKKLVIAVGKLTKYVGPTLYYGMMTQVDEKLHKLKDQQSFKKVPNYKMILFQNFVQGSTMVFNNSFLKLVNKFPIKEEVPHDIWLPILANYCGTIIGDRDSYILYRKHPGAVTVNMKKKYLHNLLCQIFSSYKMLNYAKLLLDGYKKDINTNYMNYLFCVENYKKVSNKAKLIIDRGVRKYTRKGTFLLKVAILFNRLE